MRNGIVFMILMALFGSCSKSKVPKDLLNPDKMQAVYWDYLKADLFVNEFVRKDSTKNLELESARLQNQVFQLHKTTRKQFYSSYDYYMHHPDLMKGLLDSMISKQQNANKLQDSLRQKKLKPFVLPDSNKTAL
jgi:hypothetical protein